MTVGLLAHLMGKLPYRQLAGKAAEQGMDYVQLALSKAISDVDFSLGRLSPGLANEIGGAFAEHRVGIAVLGCYASLIELDDDLFRHHVDRFKEHLRHARHFGAPIVATEVGVPRDPARSKAYEERLNRALEELVEEAERWGVTIGLEAAQGHLIASADTLAATLERFPSSCLGVVLDPCNLLHAGTLRDQDEVMREAFRLLGPRIVSAHAKDLKRGENGGVTAAAAGLGELHYPLFWQLLERHKPLGFVTLEDVQTEQLAAAARFVREGRAAARRR
ncbi:sugar phosphate isomerase/epimerase family protein [Paenibacillus glycinis]|uniref:TIM barrel protein n=1 Tax=Paenibacillus glycinis TaxID=2697035 RepID=A0ABW9XS91_9BACL|nr:sugar phosphate isomerase/epimerase [Paenibacillus glycinis]NBD25495.1 TIM barrel protein [Paenibacillus glycinis]